MTRPTLVIIPGSFSPPALYNKFAESLRSLGFETVLEGLQSAIRKEPAPSSGMYDDAAVFHTIIEKLADEGKEIILLPHSYGGVVANESAKGLLKKDREKAGKSGGVIQLVNITTVTPPVGETTYDQAADLGFDKVPIEVGESTTPVSYTKSLTILGRIYGYRRGGHGQGKLQ